MPNLYFPTPLKSKSHVFLNFTRTIFLSHLFYNVIITEPPFLSLPCQLAAVKQTSPSSYVK